MIPVTRPHGAPDQLFTWHPVDPSTSRVTLDDHLEHDAGNAGDGPATATKRKRKQFASCDACRLRRVRCERPSDDEPCNGCVKRGFVCTRDYNKSRAAGNRAGKRLDQAVALFGQQRDEPARTTSSSSSSDNLSSAPRTGDITPYEALASYLEEQRQAQAREVDFAYDSPENRLHEIQQKDFTSTCLVTCYSEYIRGKNSISAGEFDRFLQRFEGAGRRLAQLSDTDQAIADMIVATAARVTDMPLVVGQGAPDLRWLARAPTDPALRDLRMYGYSRDAICRSIEQKAKTRAEQRFFTSHLSVEGLATLLMIQSLEDMDDPESLNGAPRMYSAAAIEQLRHLARKPIKTPSETEALNGAILQSTLITDAMWAFSSGRPLQVSDEDLYVLQPSLLNLPSPSALLPNVLSPSVTVDQLLDVLAGHMIMRARDIRGQLTSPMAIVRGGPTANVWFRDCTQDLVTLLEAVEILEGRILQAPGFKLLQDLRATRWGFTIQLAFTRYYCSLILERTVDPAARSELKGYLAQMGRPFMTAMRRMAVTVGELLQDGQLLSTGLLWSGFNKTCDTYLRCPSAEEGGPPNFPLREKIRGVENFIMAMKHQAWSWPQIGNWIDALEDRLFHLKGLLATGTVPDRPLPPSPPPVPMLYAPVTTAAPEQSQAYAWPASVSGAFPIPAAYEPPSAFPPPSAYGHS